MSSTMAHLLNDGTYSIASPAMACHPDVTAPLPDVITHLPHVMAPLNVMASPDIMRPLPSAMVPPQLNMPHAAIKVCLCTKLHECKFELANLKHAYWSKQMDQKTWAHIEDAMHCCEPTITTLAKKYNAMLKQMVQLWATDPSVANAILPPTIILKTLFKLDVDDDTWHEIGLEDLEEFGGVLPPWLGDDMVQAGIHFDQEVVNCEGELMHCHMEHATMWTWFEEEYEATHFVEKYTQDTDLKYHLQLHLCSLVKLGVTWEQNMPATPESVWPELVSLDNDGETELKLAAIYDAHVMEEIDNRAQEQEWEPGDDSPE
ncbi:hypothetical protein BS47DRAFT_1368276 [Hydnum rufescens UP504]|uniref:Uncharacterized protein n=1 Tax=Hydnum rufescens UP504 TaxID=1448309 RepID=A0A9P6AFW4_9AGAM|nr:hypothetical protein BS47DRAFT_1368276 [Hydnum rufescens UP504]